MFLVKRNTSVEKFFAKKKDFGQEKFYIRDNLCQKIIFAQKLFLEKMCKFIIVLNYAYKRHNLAYSVANVTSKGLRF